MKGDFTRFTHNQKKLYNSVRMQQGRVQLDADWNEQVDIQNHLGRTQSRDVIGSSGAPRENNGFEIQDTSIGDDEVPVTDLSISDGRIYVDGILCENLPEPGSDSLYSNQTFFPQAPQLASYESGLYLIYLDVWERHITALEDNHIREVALGGPDTTTRMQTVWQVKLQKLTTPLNQALPDAPPSCWDIPAWDDIFVTGKGKLKAQARSSEAAEKPCIVPAAAGYRRLENQLYRVEIHKAGNQQTATFKWSRDNGIVATRLKNINPGDNTLLTVAEAGKDNVLNFDAGQWVEITDDYRVLHGEPGVLVRLANVDGNTLKIEAWPGSVPTLDMDTAIVRRWDHKGKNDEEIPDALPLPAVDSWIELEDGVEVAFNIGESARFNTGDYWLIPARVVGANIDWPKDGEEPRLLPPHGIKHHYCKLALAEWDGSAFSNMHDCRPLFPALSEPDLYYISGDGQEAMPGDHLPQLLRVGVTNCNRPIQGAWVKFELDKEGPAGNGLLEWTSGAVIAASDESSPVKWFIVATDENGEAACKWTLQSNVTAEDPELPAQQVRAILLQDFTDADDKRLDRPVVFSASFGVAWENQYGGARFPYPQHEELRATNVEKALDQLRENVALYHVSGGGQEARRGMELAQPLIVRVANGDWPYEGATVRFVISLGDGMITATSGDEGGSELSVLTDADGLARCYWTLDHDTYSQQVTVTLDDCPDTTLVSPSVLYFNANLSIAEEVSYTAHEESLPPAKVTVQDAIDELYEIKVNRSGDTMTGPLIIDYDNTGKREPAALVINSPGDSAQNIFDFRLKGEKHSRIRTEGDGELYLGTLLEAGLNFLTADTPQVKITAKGNVGIGTPKPEARLAINGGLHVGGNGDPGDNNLLVDGDCTIAGNLIVQGDTTTVNTATLEVEDNIIRVNKYAPQPTPKVLNGGLEVFRGGTAPEAQLVWDETDDQWKIGEKGVLHNVAYGADWITLTEDKIADGLHRHTRLYADEAGNVPALNVNEFGDIGIGITTPQARLHVSCPGYAGGTYNWTNPVDFDTAENNFAMIPAVNRLVITNNGGNGLAHRHASPQIVVFIDLQNEAGQWIEVWQHTIISGNYMFNNLVIGFPEQNVQGIRLRVDIPQGPAFHLWNGMLFTFSCDKTAALFDNRVGIKTNSPAFELDINGIVNANNIYKNGQPFDQTIGAWDLATGGISYTAGNVGIGTVAPAGDLHVHKAAGNSFIRISGNSTTANKVLDFYEGTTRQASIIARGSGIANGPPNALNIYSAIGGAPVTLGTNSGEKLRIGDDGDIDVNGDMHVSGRLYGAARNAGGVALRIFNGRTTPGATNWVIYGDNGIYVDVDTSAAGFVLTPMYFTSLGGTSAHWTAVGANSIYSPTTTGFRIYISQAGITPDIANERQYHINWTAVGSDTLIVRPGIPKIPFEPVPTIPPILVDNPQPVEVIIPPAPTVTVKIP